jgi:hypothetical protein
MNAPPVNVAIANPFSLHPEAGWHSTMVDQLIGANQSEKGFQ